MITVEFKPGEPFSLEIQITNGNSKPLPMRGIAQDFWYDEKNQNVFGPPGTLPQSASNWIEFVPPQVIVPANGSTTVRLVVTPPPKASGGFYTVAFLESKPELAEPAHEEKKALYTNIRLGSLILLAAEKTENYNLDLSGYKITPPTADDSFNIDFAASNTSNTHVFPKPTLLILDKQNHVVAKAKGEIKRFLPGQSRTLSIPWSGTLPPGDYTALLNVVFGDDKTVSKQITFSVAPTGVSAVSKTDSGTTSLTKSGSEPVPQ